MDIGKESSTTVFGGITVQGAIGYRWASELGTIYPAVQLVPFFDVIMPGHGDDNMWGFGAQAVLCLAFQH